MWEDAQDAPSTQDTQSSYESAIKEEEEDRPLTKANMKRARHRDTRVVSKLSPAQLARKRANDREAQRALRQRTKEHIAHLERRLDELSRQDTGSELLHTMQQRHLELVEQLKHVRSSMAQMQLQSVHAAARTKNIQGLFDAQTQRAMAGSAYSPVSPGRPRSTPYGELSSDEQSAPLSIKSDQIINSNQMLHAALPTRMANVAHFDLQNAAVQYDPDQVDSFMDERDGGTKAYWSELPWVAQPFQNINGTAFMPMSSGYPYVNDITFPMDSELGISQPYMDVYSGHRYSIFNMPQQCAAPDLALEMASSPLPIWARLPRFVTTKNPIDQLLRDAMQNCWLTGQPVPHDPDYGALFAPLPPRTPSQSLNSAIVMAIKMFSCRSTVPQAALLYICHLLVSWLIAPSPATYARLPVYMRPVRRQLEMPHPQWSESAVWPLLRDRMLANQKRYLTNDFILSYMEAFDVDWARRRVDGNMPIFTLNENGQVSLTMGFEAAVRDLRCWRLGETFFEKYPEVREMVRVYEE